MQKAHGGNGRTNQASAETGGETAAVNLAQSLHGVETRYSRLY